MTIDRLRAHFGFTRMPFSKEIAPSMLHRYRSHTEALARITWCIDEQAIGLITGEVGAGKTVSIRAAISAVDLSSHTIIYIGNPSIGVQGMYSMIVSTLGHIPKTPRSLLIPQAQDALSAEQSERGRKVVLILDDAHLLNTDQLEGLRLLSNAEMDSNTPFSALLVGQPTLRKKIRLSIFAALDQRIALRYSMDQMEQEETSSYVTHHLKIAGRSDTLFSEDALALIHQVSRGLPRAVNNLAVQSLVAALATSKSIVDESSARQAVAEVTTE
ncbi:MAG: ExeA family protein [Acidimicrobiales bacterium]|jgi:type II secretory pathway predicted ATPase ExeA|nr:AAA family ATPase [Actinomycetota bacterium]